MMAVVVVIYILILLTHLFSQMYKKIKLHFNNIIFSRLLKTA